MSEKLPSDYERGFADGFERGFQAGRNQQFAYQPPNLGNPLARAVSLCSCPPGSVCMNAACPHRSIVTCTSMAPSQQ